MESIVLNEFKCWDCDQVFLMAARTKPTANFCPKCGSSSTQFGAVVKVNVLESEPQG